MLIFCYFIIFKSYIPIYFSFILRKYYYNYSLEILSVRPLRTQSFTIKMSRTIKLRLKGKAPPLLPPLPPPSTIQPMALAYQGKV